MILFEIIDHCYELLAQASNKNMEYVFFGDGLLGFFLWLWFSFFVCLFFILFVLSLSNLGIDPRTVNDIFYFRKSPNTAVSPGVCMVQLKEQCFNQDVCVGI